MQDQSQHHSASSSPTLSPTIAANPTTPILPSTLPKNPLAVEKHQERMAGKAARFNTGKLRLDLIPPEWDQELGRIFTKGAFKYAPNNWKNSVNTPSHAEFREACVGCLRRHLLAYLLGEKLDPDMPVNPDTQETYAGPMTTHMGHIAWNALAIMYYDMMEEQNARQLRLDNP